MKKFHLAGFFIASLVVSGGVSSIVKGKEKDLQFENKIVAFETSIGDFQVEVFEKEAPLHSEAFLERVIDGYYDGSRFYLIGSQDFAQAGQINSAQKKYDGEFIPDEISLPNKKGTITFANAGVPDSNVPEIVINLDSNEYFDEYQSVFAEVVTGLEVLDILKDKSVDTQSKPIENIIIERAYIVESV